MYKSFEVSIQGLNPLLTHNGDILKNPLHPLTKVFKKFSGKKSKSDEDLHTISLIEWYCGLYLAQRADSPFVIQGSTISFAKNKGGKTPYIPGTMLQAALYNTAAKQKLKKVFVESVVINVDPPIIYNGPKTAAELWEHGGFKDTRDVKVNKGSSVMRSRPIFREWGLTFTIEYYSDLVDPDKILEILDLAGRINGLGDYRTRYGRFQRVEKVDIAA